MRIIDFEDTGLEYDSRDRNFNEVAHLDIQVFVTIPQATLNKLAQPGYHPIAANVLSEKLAESTSVGELLRKVDRYTNGAVVRVSGR